MGDNVKRFSELFRCGINLKLLWLIIFTLPTLLLVVDAEARRSLRVEFGATWTGPMECPENTGANGLLNGPVRPDIGLDLNGIVFSGGGVFDASSFAECQETKPYKLGLDGFEYFNGPSFASSEDFDLHPSGETGIATLVGDNTDSSVQGLQYTFYTASRFQWVIFSFPDDVALIRFQGGIVTEGTSISKSGETLFSGDSWPTYNGEFFCFKDQEFLGVWDEINFSGNDPLPGCSLDNVGQRQPPAPPKPDPAITILPAISSLLLDDGCDRFPEIAQNQIVAGTWATSDRISRTEKPFPGSFADYYVFETGSSQRFRVTLDATDVNDPVDTYLVLRRECDVAGKVSLYNDDFGIGRNSQIDTGNLQGKYLIEVTTFQSSTSGGYQLEVTPL